MEQVDLTSDDFTARIDELIAPGARDAYELFTRMVEVYRDPSLVPDVEPAVLRAAIEWRLGAFFPFEEPQREPSDDAPAPQGMYSRPRLSSALSS